MAAGKGTMDIHHSTPANFCKIGLPERLYSPDQLIALAGMLLKEDI